MEDCGDVWRGQKTTGRGQMGHQAIVIALENRYGVARLPQVLHAAGCRTTVLGLASNPVCFSRHVDRVVACGSEPRQLIAALKSLLSHCPGPRPWVIIGDETSLMALSHGRDEKWMQDLFPFDFASGFDVAMRKTCFAPAATAAGIPMPRWRVCPSLAEAESAAESLVFPVFMKRDMSTAGTGVLQLHRRDQIAPAFARLGRHAPVLLQETAAGVVGKTDVLYHRGIPWCWAHSFAVKTHPGRFQPPGTAKRASQR